MLYNIHQNGICVSQDDLALPQTCPVGQGQFVLIYIFNLTPSETLLIVLLQKRG